MESLRSRHWKVTDCHSGAPLPLDPATQVQLNAALQGSDEFRCPPVEPHHAACISDVRRTETRQKLLEAVTTGGWRRFPQYTVLSHLVASAFMMLCSESTYDIFDNFASLFKMDLKCKIFLRQCKANLQKAPLTSLCPNPQSPRWRTIHFTEVASLAQTSKKSY